MSRIVLLNKPYNVLSQFSDDQGRANLGDYVPIANVYPAGRLDRDSEGLMVLTDDGALQHKIASPEGKMSKTYWVQVEGDISNEALRSGFIGTLFGVPVFETANMANTGTTGDYKGAMFHRDALGLAMMQDLKIEIQRDASLRADEIVATAVYGVGELQDSYGIEILADSSIQ